MAPEDHARHMSDATPGSKIDASQPAGPTGETGSDDDFVELLTKNQLRLRSYVFALVRDGSAADDVMQDASAALWKLRHEYDRSRDFFRWACGVALVEVLRFRRRRASDKLLFDEALLNNLAADYVEHWEDWDRRRDALRLCLKKLTSKDQSLLDARYRSGITTADIARQLGRPLSTVYSSLARIREALYRCVQSTLAQESHR
jgi:RNA polymerase sigma-70 factor, ECF subfamily